MHRLRTPLTSIKGWTALAERRAASGASAAEVRAYLVQTMQAVRDMNSAIDAIAAEAHAANALQPLDEGEQRHHSEEVRTPSRAPH